MLLRWSTYDFHWKMAVVSKWLCISKYINFHSKMLLTNMTGY
uniref:Uncharacterized protein n=1 Tax=Rhizophora mucronata TaxID=61149 RepID=A0A2P2PM43_RHIMU